MAPVWQGLGFGLGGLAASRDCVCGEERRPRDSPCHPTVLTWQLISAGH